MLAFGRLALFAALAVPAAAQTTWIVDAAGGGHFRDLPPAVAFAAPGDTLLVRSGNYSAPTITRGLIVRGTTNARVSTGRVAVRNLPAGEHCSILDIVMDVGVDLEFCAGSVVLNACRITGPGRTMTAGQVTYPLGTLLVFDCRHVELLNCVVSSTTGWFQSAVNVYSSSVLLARSTVAGAPPSGGGIYSSQLPGGPAFSARESLVAIEAVTFRGGGDGYYNYGWWGTSPWPGPSVLGATNSELRVLGITPIDVLFQGSFSVPPVITINGRVLYDPRTGFGRYCGASTANCTPATLDFMSIAQTPTSLDFSVTADPGVTSQILVSRPGSPADLLGLGLSWLDPITVLPLAANVHQSVVWTHTVPLVAPLPAGIAVTAQAAVLRAGNITLSEPATIVLR